MKNPGGDGGSCQFRHENLRCVFVDGHPGAHVCIGPHSSLVAVRGEGDIPEPIYLFRPTPFASGSDPKRSGLVSAEDVRGEWTEAMLERLLEELYEAGISAPRDWHTSFHRLRASSERS